MKKRLFAILALLAVLLTGCVEDVVPGTAAPEETAPSVVGTLNVYCFQAGKADAFLFWNDAGSVLLDTGESGYGKTIIAKLQELGIERLDYLIITHFDKDHVGGAKKILTDFPVATVLQSNVSKNDAGPYEKYKKALDAQSMEPVTVRTPMRFLLGDTVFTVDPPEREGYQESESNNSSLIVTVTHGADRMLFTADAEDLRLAEFLKQNPGPCALVKLPHHGRYQSTLISLLDRTTPAWAIITSSEEEPEDTQTMELLQSRGVETFLTRSNPIQIQSSGSGLTVAYAL